jgi:hypothetical protein
MQGSPITHDNLTISIALTKVAQALQQNLQIQDEFLTSERSSTCSRTCAITCNGYIPIVDITLLPAAKTKPWKTNEAENEKGC